MICSRTMRQLSFAVVALPALGCGAPADPPHETQTELPGPPAISPKLKISHVRLMQPGWLRIVLDYAYVDSKDVKVKVDFVGSFPGYETALDRTFTHDHAAKRVVVDYRLNKTWLETNPTLRPLPLWLITADLVVDGSPAAFAWRPAPIEIGVPFSHWLPGRLDPKLWSSAPQPLTVPGPGHPYSAYPALQFAVKRGGFVVGFIEVEEDRERQTLRLRQSSAFDGPTLTHELLGGAEVPNNWGVNLTGRGVARPYTAAAESSNPGRKAFQTGGAAWDASFMDAPLSIHKVLRAPPIAAEPTYQNEVLDNRGVQRVLDPRDQIDVIYFQRWHLIYPGAGVELQPLSGVAPEPWDPATHVELAPAAWFPSPALAYVASNGALPLHQNKLPDVPNGNLQLPVAYTSPFARVSLDHLDRSFLLPQAPPSPIQRMVTMPSPEEQRINALAPQVPPLPPPPPPNAPPACALSEDSTKVVGAITTCAGASSASTCPTKADPIFPESYPPAPGYLDRLSLHDVLTPYQVDKLNIWGTCSTHADVQHREAVLNRYADDLAPRRFAIVDGAAIAIPEPRTAYTVGGYLSMLFTRVHTRNDSDDGGLSAATPTPIQDALTFPLIPDAYWPAHEQWPAGDDWIHRSGAITMGYCLTTGTPGKDFFAGFWRSGFCASGGTPPIGAYRSYSEQRRTHDLGLDPLGQGSWSLPRSYQPSAYESLDFSNRDAAIQTVIGELRRGVPIKFSFASVLTPLHPTVVPLSLLQDDITWYLPPELDACPLDRYRFEGGHALNIVGFYVRGPVESPDPYKSFFILQNNWGPGAGHRGYFTMNFAAFKRVGWGIERFRLRGACASSACQGT